MTVPDPVCVPCELRRCSDCEGLAYDHLSHSIVLCTCRCQRRRKTR